VGRRAAGRNLAVGLLTLLLLSMAATTASWAQASLNVERLSQWSRSGGGRSGYMDVWGYNAPDGTEIAIIGMDGGVAFIDVTNPQLPVEVGFVNMTFATHRDMRTHGTYAYAVNENGGGGLAIIDLSNPKLPVLVKNWEDAFDRAHNLHIADGYAYVVGAQGAAGTTSTNILDLSDPENPVKVGSGNLLVAAVTIFLTPRMFPF
jgi:hypothetical protein